MMKNNLMALCCLFVMDIVMFAMTSVVLSSFQSEFNPFESVIDVLLIAVMVFLFVFIGKNVLKNQGTKFRNLVSVSLACILGILIGVAYAFYYGHGVGFLAVYFTYASPILALFDTLTHGAGPQGVGLPTIRLVSSCVISIVPSLCMWLGMELSPKHTKQIR